MIVVFTTSNDSLFTDKLPNLIYSVNFSKVTNYSRKNHFHLVNLNQGQHVVDLPLRIPNMMFQKYWPLHWILVLSLVLLHALSFHLSHACFCQAPKHATQEKILHYYNSTINTIYNFSKLFRESVFIAVYTNQK